MDVAGQPTAELLVENNQVYDNGVCGISAGQGTGLEYMVAPWIQYEAYDLKIVNNETGGARAIFVLPAHRAMVAAK